MSNLHVGLTCRLCGRLGCSRCRCVQRADTPVVAHALLGVFALGALGVVLVSVTGAEEQGYLTVHWAKVRADAESSLAPLYKELRQVSLSPRELQARLDEVLSWNLPGAAGFAEGLLFACGGRTAKLVAVGSAAAAAAMLQNDSVKIAVDRVLADADAALAGNRRR